VSKPRRTGVNITETSKDEAGCFKEVEDKRQVQERQKNKVQKSAQNRRNELEELERVKTTGGTH